MDPRIQPTIDLGPPFPVKIDGLPPYRLEPGKWYLAWRCRECEGVVAVMDDPTCGAIRVRLEGRGVVYFTCRCCGSIEVQTPGECVQYQRAPGVRQRHRVVDKQTSGANSVPFGPRLTLAERTYRVAVTDSGEVPAQGSGIKLMVGA